MALYVPAGRRRRNLILGLVGALVVGLVIGGVPRPGHRRPMLSDKVAKRARLGERGDRAVQATPIEYEKQLAGSTEFEKGGTVVQSLTDAEPVVAVRPRRRGLAEPAAAHDHRASAGNRLGSPRRAAKVAAARYEDAVATTATFIESSLGIAAAVRRADPARTSGLRRGADMQRRDRASAPRARPMVVFTVTPLGAGPTTTAR